MKVKLSEVQKIMQFFWNKHTHEILGINGKKLPKHIWKHFKWKSCIPSYLWKYPVISIQASQVQFTKGLILLAYRIDSFLTYKFLVHNHLFKTDLAKFFQNSNWEISHNINLLLLNNFLVFSSA